jgi:diguanylate cyclase (GGDEF)-like protein/PAS domain S-box-containing protein
MTKNNTPKSELRRQAEAKASIRKQKKSTTPVTEADTQRLLHELEVHQIELEMQNEELVQSRVTAEDAYHQYSALYDFAPVGYFMLMPGGTIRKVNLAGANLLGEDRANLLNRRLALFVSEESRPAFSAFLEKLLSGVGKETCELELLKHGTSSLWARLEATCFEGGQESRVVVMDISERVRAEEALRESERLYRELIELAVDGILIGSPDGLITAANSHMLNLSGRTLDDLVGEHVSALFDPDELKSAPLQFDQLQKGKTVTNKRNLIRPDGKVIPIEMHTKMMPNGSYQSIYHDITERQQAEEALRAAAQHWQDTFNAIGDAISLVDLDGYIIRHNRAMSAWTGKTASEIDGHLCYEVMHGYSKPIENCPVQRMKESKHREKLIFELDGRQLNVTVDPIFNSAGQLTGATHIVSDITERLQMQKALQTSESNLKAIFENSPQSFMLIDKNRTIQSCNGNANENAKTIFGREIQQGDSIYVIVSPQEHGSFDKNFERALAGETIRVEKKFEVEVGTLWFEFHYAPVFTDNEISGVFLGSLNITERKQAEESLKQSEAQYRLLADNMTDVIWLRDLNLNLLYISPSEEKIRGYTMAELQQFSLDQLLTPDSFQAVMELFTNEMPKVLADPTYSMLHTREFQFYRRDGRLHTVESNISLVRDENGNPTAILGQDRDITERKRAEEALRVSEERFRLLTNNVPDIIYSLNGEGNIITVNSSAFERYGYTEQDAKGKPFLSFIHPEDHEIVVTSFLKAMEEQRKFTRGLQFRLVAENGISYWFELNSQARYDSQNQYIGEDGVLRDITERKRAEDSLRESEEKYRRLFNNAVLGVFQSTPEGKAISVNHAFAHMFGYESPEDVIQNIKNVATDIFADPNRRAEIMRLMEENPGLKTFENLYRRKDGSTFFGSLNTMPVRDINGSLIRVEGIIEDITERKRAEDSLRESEEKFRVLVEQSMDGVILIDEQGMIIEWNTAESKITGVPRATALGAAFWDIQHQIMTPERRMEMTPQYLKKTYFESYLDGKTDYLEKPRDIEIVTPSGEHKFLQQASFIVKTEKGQRMGSVIHDITERKLAEVELQYMKESLKAANTELQTALTRQQQLAHIDALTGINNRRHLYELAEHEFEIAVRYQQPLSVIMFDIDHFKEVNDTFGHAAGDQILQQVVQVACRELRSADVIGRYGGEEFVIVLPMTNAQQAYPLAERIRLGVAAIRQPTEKGDAAVTLSIGIVEIMHGAQPVSIEHMIHNSDKAMYAAKQAGRNRTEIWV